MESRTIFLIIVTLICIGCAIYAYINMKRNNPGFNLPAFGDAMIGVKHD